MASQGWLRRSRIRRFNSESPVPTSSFQKEKMHPKEITGPYGRANAYDLDSMHKKHGPSAAMAAYCIHVPWANMLWTDYEVLIMHLRPVPGKHDPVIKFRGATHEIVVSAIHPDCSFHPCRAPVRLDSVNYVGQFIDTDEGAITKTINVVRECVDGETCPDEYWRQHWIARFGSSNIKGDVSRAGESI